MRLILASASPRRAQVLRDAGIEFEARPVQVREIRRLNETPEAMVQRLAEEKAAAGAAGVTGAALVIGADTAVVCEGAVLGKPASRADAQRMLHLLAGRTHRVITGLAVLSLPDRGLRVELETTRVTFAAMTERDVEEYVACCEPLDKAGAYGIQGRGGKFVTRIEGCYFNVVGLPLARLCLLMNELGGCVAASRKS